jgi:hypothetical protein
MHLFALFKTTPLGSGRCGRSIRLPIMDHPPLTNIFSDMKNLVSKLSDMNDNILLIKPHMSRMYIKISQNNVLHVM